MRPEDEYIDQINEEEISEEEILAEEAVTDDRFSQLTAPSQADKHSLGGMFKEWFLDYSSYVILYRAVPNIVDGLKPVQRRVLHAMYRKDDGRFTKVATLVGEAMKFHPHGDSSILGAMVTLGQKGFLIDCQGNWGNIITGDGNAAARYIEGRLSKFALDVCFNPKITPWMASYDGREKEPTELPIKFPLLLAQGTEGIAVGMRSSILPHNFCELCDAAIAYLKGEPYELYPDFPTGGIADCSHYNDGARGGYVKVRAKIEKVDKSTIAITELPYSKTVPTIIDSILKARDKGKIKIKKLDNLTASEANIIINLPADVSPDKTIDALYACTDCETKLNPNACVIVDSKPQFLTVGAILEYSVDHTRELFRRELELRLSELEDSWHYTSLERIFFENKVYRILEVDSRSWDEQLSQVHAKMLEFQDQVHRPIAMEDIEKLVEKPVRKISKFDIKAANEKIRGFEKEMKQIRHDLAHLTEYTIAHFERLKTTYGAAFPRKTQIAEIETIDTVKVISNNAKLYVNYAEGFVGTALKKEDGVELLCDCSDLSEIIVFNQGGKYIITKVSPKAFLGKDIIHVGLFDRNDKRTTYNVIYRQGKSSVYYAKRFAVTGVTRDKEYDLTTGEPDSKVMYFSANSNGEAESVRINLRPKPKLKKTTIYYDFSTLAIKGRASRGNLVTKFSIAKITSRGDGVSTIGGKSIWFNPDVLRLNEDGYGTLLGEFSGADKIVTFYKNGLYGTSSYDLSSKFNEGIVRIEKLDSAKIYSVLYYDAVAQSFYIKRFTVDISADLIPFIATGKGSYLVAISDDLYPTMVLRYGGRNASRPEETVGVADFIAVKGVAAKGKKVSPYDVASVEFGAPTEVEPPEEDVTDEATDEAIEDVTEDIKEDSLEVGDILSYNVDSNGEATLF